MKGALPTETIVLFIGMVLAASIVTSILLSTVGSLVEKEERVSSVVGEGLGVFVKPVSSFTISGKTYVFFKVVGGSLSSRQTKVLFNGAPVEAALRTSVGDGDPYIEEGEIWYVVLPFSFETGEVSLSSLRDVISLGKLSPETAYFRYRRKITISSSTPLLDFQVLIELNSDNFDFSHTSLCSDLRFYDENGRELPYYVERCDGSRALVWVRAPSVETNTVIYMYYGFPGLPSDSNGQKTFIFFDDFTDLSSWNLSGNCGSVKTDVVDGKTVVVLTAPSGAPCAMYLKESLQGLDNVVLDFMVKNFGGAADLDFYWGIDNDPWSPPNWGSRLGDNASGQYHACVVDESVSTVGSTYAQPVWLVDSVSSYGGQVTCSYNGETLSASGSPITSGLILIQFDPDSTLRGIYGDWIRVRRYADPMPSVVVGPEESGRFTP